MTVRLNENGREEVGTFPVLQPYSFVLSCVSNWSVNSSQLFHVLRFDRLSSENSIVGGNT